MIARLPAVAAGVWLMFSPDVLGYGDPAHTDHRAVGPFIGSFAFVAIWEVIRAARWAALPLGAWLIVSPFLLGYAGGAAMVSGMAAGAVTVASTFFGPGDRSRYGGGWRSLFGRPPEQAAS